MLIATTHILLIFMIILAKGLISEDLKYCSVPKIYTTAFIACAVLLRLFFWGARADDADVFIACFGMTCLRALGLILPLLLIHYVKGFPGKADIKYCFCVALLLPVLESYLLIILACFWALVGESLHKKKHSSIFAFLPYLIFSTLPFIIKKYWTIGGFYGKT